MSKYNIGEEFEYKGVTLVTVESTSCCNCYFASYQYCPLIRECSANRRLDRIDVCFQIASGDISHLEYVVGASFEYQGISLVTILGSSCDFCYFRNYSCDNINCKSGDRLDKNDVYFLEITNS